MVPVHNTSAPRLFGRKRTRVWVAKRKALPDVWLGWIVALLTMNGAHDKMLYTPRSRGRSLLT